MAVLLGTCGIPVHQAPLGRDRFSFCLCRVTKTPCAPASGQTPSVQGFENRFRGFQSGRDCAQAGRQAWLGTMAAGPEGRPSTPQDPWPTEGGRGPHWVAAGPYCRAVPPGLALSTHHLGGRMAGGVGRCPASQSAPALAPRHAFENGIQHGPCKMCCFSAWADMQRTG